MTIRNNEIRNNAPVSPRIWRVSTATQYLSYRPARPAQSIFRNRWGSLNIYKYQLRHLFLYAKQVPASLCPYFKTKLFYLRNFPNGEWFYSILFFFGGKFYRNYFYIENLPLDRDEFFLWKWPKYLVWKSGKNAVVYKYKSIPPVIYVLSGCFVLCGPK
jgi:hypothetical protein